MKNRREFLKTSLLGAAGLSLAPTLLQGAPAIIKSYNKPNSLINGVQIGCITYSYRSMQDQSLEANIRYIKESGISAVEMMGEPVEYFAGMPSPTFNRMRGFQLGFKQRNGENLTSDEQQELAEIRQASEAYAKVVSDWRAKVDYKKFEQVKKMFKDEGISIYAFKPSAFGMNNSELEISYGMKTARILGASHVTLEHPDNDGHTMILGKMGEKHKMSIGYHGHEQQTFTFWDKALAQSPKNGLNFDAGHYVAAGHRDMMELIQKQHYRILSMHIKDRQKPENGKGNLPWGTGDTPLKDILTMISKQKYKFPATIELEYQVPQSSDAVKEVQKCLEFCRKALG
ncbi:sugar phosphate isomerase/epimerase family protein [Fontibacter flavus]|uniref:Sugar phosphate isomerase/epimerase family protein n=1 Tax=Fontibacter flavus TaxID=654838 RepID=A0ABV6FV94_9BACT